MTSFDKLKKTQSKPSRIAVVQACWHRDIVDRCVQSFISEITKLTDNTVEIFEVPGAYEIPLQAKLLANSGQYSAVVGAGLVVDGGIYRHDFVAQAVVSGMMQVQLETLVPVFSVVLTPHNFQETDEHRNFFSEHFVKKGAEAAHSCAATLSLMESTAVANAS